MNYNYNSYQTILLFDLVFEFKSERELEKWNQNLNNISNCIFFYLVKNKDELEVYKKFARTIDVFDFRVSTLYYNI